MVSKSLTAIIPVGNVGGELFSLPAVINDCKGLGVEIIIVHDDFNDGTSDSLNLLSQNFHGLKVVSGIYRSPGVARNVGLQELSTDWFCFWDADDYPKVHEYVRAIEEHEDNSEPVIIGNFSTKDAKTGEIRNFNLPAKGTKRILEIAMNPGIWRFIFRSDLYKNVKFGNGTMGEDQLFLARLDLSEDDLHLVERDFYQYSVNLKGQLTGEKHRTLELMSVIQEEQMLRKNSRGSNLIDYLILKQGITLMKYKKTSIFCLMVPLLHSLKNIKFSFLLVLLRVIKNK